MTRKRSIIRGALISAFVLGLASCPPPVWETFGLLTFPDFAGYKGIMGGQLGEVEFGNVLVGENEPYVLTMQNSSNRPLVIDRISFDSIHYDFYDHVSPAFPLTLAAGETTDMLCIGFYPQVNGEQQGRIVFEVNDRIVYLGLNGSGVWELTLLNDNTGSGRGTIISPVTVAQNVTGVYQSSDGKVNLIAEAESLSKFSRWSVVGTPKQAPEFDGGVDTAGDVWVTLNAHTTIRAVFNDPNNYYSATGSNVDPDFTSLQAAIDDCVTDPLKEAVVIRYGTHAIATDIILASSVCLFGGYEAGVLTAATPRHYKTAAERSGSGLAVLSFSAGTGLSIAADASASTLLEGITITRSAAGSSPVLTVASGAKPVIRYTTITAAGAGPALKSNGGSPTIRYSVITGGNSADSSTGAYLIGGAPYLEYNTIASGNTTANYSETRALHLQDFCYADLFKNTVTTGNAGGTGSESFGMFVDFGSRPLVVGNTISGGSATGSGGMSNGIYFINNGSATLRYNTIDGGTGALMSRALYSAYGTNFYVRNNNFSVGSGSGTGYGVYLGTNGRVRRFGGNGFSDDFDVYQYTYLTDDEVDDIDDLNEIYLSSFLAFFGTTVEGGTNVVGTATIPADYTLGARE